MKRKTRLLTVLSGAWIIGWTVFVNHVIAGGYWDEEDLTIFVYGLVPVAVPWAIAWVLRGKKG